MSSNSRSIAGVPFDSVGILRTTLILRTTCVHAVIGGLDVWWHYKLMTQNQALSESLPREWAFDEVSSSISSGNASSGWALYDFWRALSSRSQTTERTKITRPCSPTLGKVDWFGYKTPPSQSHHVPPNLKTHMSQSHPVPPIMETPLSQSHLSHVLRPVWTCPIWLYYLSFPNSLF